MGVNLLMFVEHARKYSGSVTLLLYSDKVSC